MSHYTADMSEVAFPLASFLSDIYSFKGILPPTVELIFSKLLFTFGAISVQAMNNFQFPSVYRIKSRMLY